MEGQKKEKTTVGSPSFHKTNAGKISEFFFYIFSPTLASLNEECAKSFWSCAHWSEGNGIEFNSSGWFDLKQRMDIWKHIKFTVEYRGKFLMGLFSVLGATKPSYSIWQHEVFKVIESMTVNGKENLQSFNKIFFNEYFSVQSFNPVENHCVELRRRKHKGAWRSSKIIRWIFRDPFIFII